MGGSTCCSCLLGTIRATPVVFNLLILFWSYYAYVVVFCIQFVYTILEQVLFGLFYHFFFIMFLWSFTKAIFTKPLRPPHDYFLTPVDWAQIDNASEEQDKNRVLENIIINRKLPVETTNDVGVIRICKSCSLIKPDRAHHCSTCGCCLLKMDHHCPWVNNCVGFHNYKYFVVFLFWGSMYCLYIICTSIMYFIEFWQDLRTAPPTRYNFLFVFFVAIMFGFSQMILLFYHLYLVGANRTTLEGFRAPTFRGSGADKLGFNIGCRQNFKEVFGDNCLLALIPTFTSRGSGCAWPRRGHIGFTYRSLENANWFQPWMYFVGRRSRSLSLCLGKLTGSSHI